MRVAITGSTGQVGRAFKQVAPAGWEISGVSSADVDICVWRAVRDWIGCFGPDLVIHAAAMTDVDGCETDPGAAFRSNALGTRNVARAAERVGARLVYFSTNFVFDGRKSTPYDEFDQPVPISVYGRSKLAGEREVVVARLPAYIVRTAMVFDERGRNFVNTMRRLMNERDTLRVVADQTGNPTYAPDLATGVVRLLETYPPGTYHLTNRDATSWFGWASAIRELCGLDCELVPIPASEYQRAATPPANGAMTSLMLEGADMQLPHWRDALSRCLT